MTDLAPPPVPATLDLRDFRWMKLDLIALFNSDFNATADDTAWRAGVTLWGKAWHQVPAGSLPDDDATLCNLAGLGRDLRMWRKIRETALRGFKLHSDGRLYHSYVCKMAMEAAEERARFEKRKEADRERKKKGNPYDGDRNAAGIPPENLKPPEEFQNNSTGGNDIFHGIPRKNAVEGQGQGQLVPLAKANGGSAAGCGVTSAGKPEWWPKRDRYGRVLGELTEKILFDTGKAVLGGNAGGQVTKLLKCYRHDLRAVADFVLQAEEKSNPREWFAGVLKRAEMDERPDPKHVIYPDTEYRV